MPLVRDGAFVEDSFTRIGGDWELPVNSAELGDAIVPIDWLNDLTPNWPNKSRIGIDIGNDAEWDVLEPHLDRLSLIAIAFPSFSDGRGFSLAQTLRNRGYRGLLRARGPLIADQYWKARACGFDEVEIPESLALRQPESLWRAAAHNQIAYQSGYRAKSIFDQRRISRSGEGHG